MFLLEIYVTGVLYYRHCCYPTQAECRRVGHGIAATIPVRGVQNIRVTCSR